MRRLSSHRGEFKKRGSAERGAPHAGILRALLVQHVSPSNAVTYGITMFGEAVVDGQHTFYIILNADNEDNVKEFMKPFYMAGTVEVWPASSLRAGGRTGEVLS
jgi:hypothetical protein